MKAFDGFAAVGRLVCQRQIERIDRTKRGVDRHQQAAIGPGARRGRHQRQFATLRARQPIPRSGRRLEHAHDDRVAAAVAKEIPDGITQRITSGPSAKTAFEIRCAEAVHRRERPHHRATDEGCDRGFDTGDGGVAAGDLLDGDAGIFDRDRHGRSKPERDKTKQRLCANSSTR